MSFVHCCDCECWRDGEEQGTDAALAEMKRIAAIPIAEGQPAPEIVEAKGLCLRKAPPPVARPFPPRIKELPPPIRWEYCPTRPEFGCGDGVPMQAREERS